MYPTRGPDIKLHFSEIHTLKNCFQLFSAILSHQSVLQKTFYLMILAKNRSLSKFNELLKKLPTPDLKQTAARRSHWIFYFTKFITILVWNICFLVFFFSNTLFYACLFSIILAQNTIFKQILILNFKGCRILLYRLRLWENYLISSTEIIYQVWHKKYRLIATPLI